MKVSRKVKWNKIATENLESAVSYIRIDSVKNAEKVKQDIVSKIKNLSSNSEKYPLDKYKLNNDGSYRAFEQHHYRIVYRVLRNEIRIITIRHTSMEPLKY